MQGVARGWLPQCDEQDAPSRQVQVLGSGFETRVLGCPEPCLVVAHSSRILARRSMDDQVRREPVDLCLLVARGGLADGEGVTQRCEVARPGGYGQ